MIELAPTKERQTRKAWPASESTSSKIKGILASPSPWLTLTVTTSSLRATRTSMNKIRNLQLECNSWNHQPINEWLASHSFKKTTSISGWHSSRIYWSSKIIWDRDRTVTSWTKTLTRRFWRIRKSVRCRTRRSRMDLRRSRLLTTTLMTRANLAQARARTAIANWKTPKETSPRTVAITKTCLSSSSRHKEKSGRAVTTAKSILTIRTKSWNLAR